MKNIFKIVFIAFVIVSSFTQTTYAGEILVVLSGKDHVILKEGKTFQTGFYLNELMQPVKRFLDKGHTVTFATPKGQAPSMDKNSDNAMFFGDMEKKPRKAKKSLKVHKSLLKKLKLMDKKQSPVISLARVKQIGYDHFDALYVPGGLAPMNDLIKEMEVIVNSGTRLNINYALDEILDDDQQEEIHDYFLEDAETDDIETAMEEFDGEYEEEELRLYRIKFFSEVAN